MAKKLLPLIALLFFISSGYSQITSNGWTLSYSPSTLCAGDTACFSIVNINNPPPGPVMQAYAMVYFPGMNVFTLTSTSSQYCIPILSPGLNNVLVVFNTSAGMDSINFPVMVGSICPGIDIIRGTVYRDLNGNGIRDTSEMVESGRLVQLNPGGLFVSSNTAGQYSFTVPAGSFTISLVPPMYNTITQPVGNSYSIVTTGSSAMYSGNDFGIQHIPGINDLEIYISGGPPVPGMQRVYYVNYRNVGTTTLSGSVDFIHDALMTYVSTSATAPTYTAGIRTLSWNFTNMAPGASAYEHVRLQCPTTAVLGTGVTHYVAVNPIIGDTTPLNNVDTLTRLVVGSYDPNDKISYHDENSDAMFIDPMSRLDYRIRFQNTGTYYATDVIIRDTLDANLDVSSLVVQGSSHAMTWTLEQERILSFNFMNIMLPDSNMDEPGSHGHVLYAISPKPGLVDGNQIKNTAAIYFDFNSPIFTNTHVNEVEIPVISLSPESNGFVKAWPNPTDGIVSFELDNVPAGDWSIAIVDLNGKEIVKENKLSTQKVNLDLKGLAPGLYIWRIAGSDYSQSGKLMLK